MGLLAALWCLGAAAGLASNASTLREAAAGRIFVGYASAAAHLNNASDPQYKAVGNAQYNLATAENECKFGPTEPAQGQFSFGGCDAVSENMLVAAGGVFRGHNIVWGHMNPDWCAQRGTGGACVRACVCACVRVRACVCAHLLSCLVWASTNMNHDCLCYR